MREEAFLSNQQDGRAKGKPAITLVERRRRGHATNDLRWNDKNALPAQSDRCEKRNVIKRCATQDSPGEGHMIRRCQMQMATAIGVGMIRSCAIVLRKIDDSMFMMIAFDATPVGCKFSMFHAGTHVHAEFATAYDTSPCLRQEQEQCEDGHHLAGHSETNPSVQRECSHERS